jgi:purine-cytosine permease-like protein
MSPTPSQFRGIIVLSLLSGIGDFYLNFAHSLLIPESLRTADAALTSSASTSLPILILELFGFVILFVAALVGIVGLLKFKPWSRPLNLALTVVTLVLWPLMGYNLSSGWAQALNDLSLYLWGSAIALAYWSPLSERFASNGR